MDNSQAIWLSKEGGHLNAHLRPMLKLAKVLGRAMDVRHLDV